MELSTNSQKELKEIPIKRSESDLEAEKDLNIKDEIVVDENEDEQGSETDADDINFEFFDNVTNKLSSIEQLLEQVIKKNFNIKTKLLVKMDYDKTDSEPSVNEDASWEYDGSESTENYVPTSSEFEFPLRRIDDLLDLDTQIINDPDTADHMKSYLEKLNMTTEPYNDMTQVLNILVTDDVICKMDWDGFHGKTQMSQLLLFSKILFDAWKTDQLEYNDYEQMMRRQIRKAYKRRTAL